MEQSMEKQMLKSIEITRDSMKNCMQISLESYTEILSRLDLLSYILTNKDIK